MTLCSNDAIINDTSLCAVSMNFNTRQVQQQ